MGFEAHQSLRIFVTGYGLTQLVHNVALLPNHFVVDASLPKSELLQQVIKCLEGGKIDASIAEELLQDSLSDLGRAPQIPPKIIFLIGTSPTILFAIQHQVKLIQLIIRSTRVWKGHIS
jgi:hypothetical protein